MLGKILTRGGCILVLLASYPAARAQQADPCPNAQPVPAQLRAPPPLPPGENFAFEREMLAYLSTYHYRNLGWCSDKGVRDTGDWVNTVYYGTHPAVRIYYSPEVMDWLRKGRQGKIADGAVILKEHYSPPAIRWNGTPDSALKPSDWTFMIKNSAVTKDGWFWGEVWMGMQFDNRLQYPNTGYGIYCVRCHASAENEHTFSSLSNIQGFPGDPLQFRVDDTWRTVAPGVPGPATAPTHPTLELMSHRKNELIHEEEAAAPKPHTLQAATGRFLSLFPGAKGTAERAPVPFPAASYDHYIAAPGTPNTFITSDQCQSCHSAAAPGNYGPTMYLGQGGGVALNLLANSSAISLQSAGPQMLNINVSPSGSGAGRRWGWRVATPTSSRSYRASSPTSRRSRTRRSARRSSSRRSIPACFATA